MFKQSENTAELDVALAKAQSQIKAAVKDRDNPFFKSKYATLEAVWDACREALGKNGISVTQWLVHNDDNRLHLVTRVAHAGQWMISEMSLPVSKNDPQGYGSATTYARRFALSAAVGVVADEDDDGNAASAPKAEPKKPNNFAQRKKKMFAVLCEYFEKHPQEGKEPAQAASDFIVELTGQSYKSIASEGDIELVSKAFKELKNV